MAQNLAIAMKFIKSQKVLFGNSLVAVLSGSFEQIYQTATFKCPCSPGINQIYAAASLLVPALVLLIIGYTASLRTWKLITGSCSYRRIRGFGGLVRFLRILLAVTGRALVAPVTWLFVALFDGSYYVCGTSPYATQVQHGFLGGWLPTVANGLAGLPGPLAAMNHSQLAPILAALPCRRPDGVPVAAADQILRQLAIQSQIWGWLLLAAAAVLGTCFTCVAYCTSPVSYLHLQYWKGYIEAEQDYFHKKAAEHSRNLASSNVDRFFQREAGGDGGSSVANPTIADWNAVSCLYVFREGALRYSTLDSWAHDARPPTGALASPEGAIESSLAFVDGRPILRLKDALSVDGETEPLNGTRTTEM